MPRAATRTQRAPASYIMLTHTPEWRAWIEEFSESARHPKQVLVDQALEDFAQKRGFKRPPVRLANRS